MPKAKVSYRCRTCGAQSPVMLGRCAHCQDWDSLEAVAESPAPTTSRRSAVASLRPAGAEVVSRPLGEVSLDPVPAWASGLTELDRVLGGGLFPGAVVLLGGDPGIGKSTLMLQWADRLAGTGRRILYVAGEESLPQVRQRAGRLGMTEAGLSMQMLAETRLPEILAEIEALRPDLVIVDSIQSLMTPESPAAPGTPTQIRECAMALQSLAKALPVAVVLVGHVTKEGALSGPKLLEHLVDTVLYFEGDRFQDLRILRAVKNRFGSTQEIGVFEMTADGLSEVRQPSERFLSDGGLGSRPGSVLTVTLAGSRPLLVEVQALVGLSQFSAPRRVANGIAFNRLHQILAILERRVGLECANRDVYVNVVGGLSVVEPAIDLAVALAVVTSHRNVPIQPQTVVAGELGLTGEVRPVTQRERRWAEAQGLGFQRLVLPVDPAARRKGPVAPLAGVVEVHTLLDALVAALEPAGLHPISDEEEMAPLREG